MNGSDVPFAASYSSGLWKYKLTIPWVEIEGAGTVVGAGGGGVVIGNPNQGNEELVPSKESGLGDIWLSATYIGSEYIVIALYFQQGKSMKSA